jgi:thioredoxin 1
MKLISSRDFPAEVLQAKRAVLVDFFTWTCQPCRRVEPWIEEIEAEHAGILTAVRVDASAEPEFTAQFRVMSVPTLLLFQAGQPLGQLTAPASKAAIARWVAELLG